MFAVRMVRQPIGQMLNAVIQQTQAARGFAAAIQNLHDISAVEGLDAVVIGLADLARDLGHAGDDRHPAVRNAVDQIISIVNAARSKSTGAVAGFNLHHWEEGRELQAQGVRWFTIHAKTMLARGMRDLNTLLGAAPSR